MRKTLSALLTALVLFSVSLSAQSPYEQGGGMINAGIGIGSTLTGSMTLPPVNGSYEMGVTENISAGGYLGFAMSEESYLGYTWDYTHIIVGARGSYHFFNESSLNAYAGFMVGYNIVSVSSPDEFSGDSFSTAASGITYSAHVGGRYFFTEALGAYAELGYGVSYLNLGLALKI